ncbi:peroxisomal biogenesis factor 13 [Rhynchophorus ferrugineus]|uniref:Peroxisomal membrane protein PEX13 n=1 Tax=Rhynchophorus ferrugineus TaxID=354439 RepID=A0A834MCQ3_RHYFE|nr:hypothetical protein GWI33_014061 [Rhynchophorus ferrugineus]
MTSGMKPWDSSTQLQNLQVIRNQNANPPFSAGRSAPVLPPRPMGSGFGVNSYNQFSSPYSLSSYNSPYSSYGSFGAPYRNSYGSYGSYGSFNNYGSFDYPSFTRDDHERRFIQYAEDSSRRTFANVESVVRAVNSLAMMLDNTFFAMTSSFRAVLGVAENFGRLRTMFGHIWYSFNVFRLITWLYRRMRQILGLKVTKSPNFAAWKEAANGMPGGSSGPNSGSSWPTLAFLGVIVSAPYIISRFLPKYEDKLDPANWKSPGVMAKACFDFIATSPNELTIHTNDNITLAPAYIQEEMNLKNTGWAYAVHNGKAGVVPLNYIVISKKAPDHPPTISVPTKSTIKEESSASPAKTHTKRVSFGDIQIFDTEDCSIRKESIPPASPGDDCNTTKSRDRK